MSSTKYFCYTLLTLLQCLMKRLSSLKLKAIRVASGVTKMYFSSCSCPSCSLITVYLLLMKPVSTPFSNNLFNLQISFYQRNLTHQPFGKEFDLTAIIVYYFFFSFPLLFLATYFVLLFLL